MPSATAAVGPKGVRPGVFAGPGSAAGPVLPQDTTPRAPARCSTGARQQDLKRYRTQSVNKARICKHTSENVHKYVNDDSQQKSESALAVSQT